jgi:hypothetical protein
MDSFIKEAHSLKSPFPKLYILTRGVFYQYKNGVFQQNSDFYSTFWNVKKNSIFD